MMPIKEFYKNRFNKSGIKKREGIWKTLSIAYFQKFINSSDTVIDIGAGYCEFINSITCFKKYAIDINPDTQKYANKDVEVINDNAISLPKSFNNVADVVFISNFLEHLNSKEEVLRILIKAKEILKKNGRLLILQPNIDLVKERYWDFFDHRTPLNGASLREALVVAGFDVELFIEKFLPYSITNNNFPTFSFIIKTYLILPSMLRFFAGQSFVAARKI